MKIRAFIIIVSLLPILSSQLVGQIVLVDSYFYLRDEIGEETLDEIIESVEDALDDYVKYARLTEGDNSVSQKNMYKFKNLFANNAKILDDFSDVEKPGQMNFTDYAGEVFEYLSDEGIQFDMYGALIDVISYDSIGYYKVDIITQKFVYNGLQTDKRPFYCKKGRRYRMNISYRIPVENISSAKIMKINGTLEESCEENKIMYSVGLQGGLLQSSYATTDFWKSELNDLAMDPILGNEVGIGLIAQYPLVKSKALYLGLGANYSRSIQRMDIDGVFESTSMNEEGESYRKISNLNKGEEMLKMNSLTIPLGLRWHAWGKEPFYFFFDIYGLVKIPLSYQSYIEMEEIRTGIFEDGEVVEFNISEAGIEPYYIYFNPEVNTKVNYSAQLSFSFQYAVSESFAIEVALFHARGLTSVFENTPSTTYPLSIEDSFLTRYTNGLKSHSTGLKFGLIIKP